MPTTNRWTGNTVAGAQVDTVTIGTYDATTTYSVTIGNKTISQIGTGGTNATTAAALQTLLAASVIPEFLEWTWTVVSAVITATFKTPGEAGLISASVTGGTGTISHATPTANSGPNDVGAAGNYSAGSLPANGDTLIIDTGSNSLLWNLSALSAVTLAQLTRRVAWTGGAGLPEFDTTGYYEFRPTEFTVSATAALIEQASSDQAAGLKFNFGSVQTTLQVLGQGAASLDSEVMWWRGTNASNVVDVTNGSLAIAPAAATVATVATLNADSSTVRCGSGCTLTTVNNFNSTMEFNSNIGTTYNQNGTNAASFFKASAGITTANINAGTCNWNGSGGITTLTLAGTLDFSQGSAPVTITNTVILGKGANFNDPRGRVTFSGSPSFQLAAGATLADVTINLGAGRNYTVV